MFFHTAAAIAATLSTQSVSQQLTDLRDEGIRNIVCVAGNAYGHRIWPQVWGFVGEGGEYYDFFVRLRAPDEDANMAAPANVRLYNQCRDQGDNVPFNGRAGISRIQRAIDISNEFGALMRLT